MTALSKLQPVLPVRTGARLKRHVCTGYRLMGIKRYFNGEKLLKKSVNFISTLQRAPFCFCGSNDVFFPPMVMVLFYIGCWCDGIDVVRLSWFLAYTMQVRILTNTHTFVQYILSKYTATGLYICSLSHSWTLGELEKAQTTSSVVCTPVQNS